jgi:hypothetical protein
MFLDLLARVEGEVPLQLLLDLEVILMRGTPVPDGDEVIVVLLWPAKVSPQRADLLLDNFHLLFSVPHFLLDDIQLISECRAFPSWADSFCWSFLPLPNLHLSIGIFQVLLLLFVGFFLAHAFNLFIQEL